MWVLLALLFGGLVAIAYIAVGHLRHWAQQQMLDIPNERSSHNTPTPRGGGLVFVIFSLLFTLGYSLLTTNFGLLVYITASGLIALISWRDDKKNVPTLIRFGTHFAGATLLILSFGSLSAVTVPFLGTIPIHPFLVWIITLLWLVGLTNAYNFMDGIDGLAGLQGFIAAVGWFIVGWLVQDNFLIGFSLVLGASLIGFLAHNWSPAKIFMGDVGSAFLGFSFAVLPLLTAPFNKQPYNPAYPFLAALFLWPFIFDTSITMLIRLKNRENILKAHRSHLYQKLVIAGYSHAQVTILYAILAAWGVALGLGWFNSTNNSQLHNWFVTLILFTIPLLSFILYATVQKVTSPNPNHSQ
jgi:UDP-N-acetylmuramyl pentapeptide phosphotransferase/UDP-N-acetylglucosamine-1-phosphate transferase